MKLKSEYINKAIFIPQLRKTLVGKFIPESYYPLLSKKYPQFFELEVKTKTIKQNDILIDDTIITSSDNTTNDNSSDEFIL